MDFLRALITAPVSITVLFLLSKFIGNKQMSSLNLFDYINGITIGSIAAEMATAEMSDFWACFAALIVYVIIVMLCSWLSQKSTMLRRFLTGKSIVIFDRGKLYKKNFSVAKIDINEFLTRMREKGYFSLDDVETVFPEPEPSPWLLRTEKFSRKILPNRALILNGSKNSLTTTANGSKMFFSVCVMIRET